MKDISRWMSEAASSRDFVERVLALAGGEHRLVVELLRRFARDHGCDFNDANLALQTEGGLKSVSDLLGDVLADIFVLGGAATAPDDFPECVALLRGSTREVVGSGVIVAPNVILCAGHSVNGKVDEVWVGVKVGEQKGEKAGRAYSVAQGKACPHFDYVGEGYHGPPRNDLGFLRVDGLDWKDRMAQHVEPGVVRAQTPSTGWLVGFGSNDVQGGSGTGVQRMARIPVVWDIVVDSLGRPIRMDKDREFVAGTPLCSNDPKDACGDDSGAPFWVEVDGDPKLFGLTSRRAARDDRPCGSGAVYTRVDAYGEWIAKVVASDGGTCPVAAASRS